MAGGVAQDGAGGTEADAVVGGHGGGAVYSTRGRVENAAEGLQKFAWRCTKESGNLFEKQP
jgi:hypothetical protein